LPPPPTRPPPPPPPSPYTTLFRSPNRSARIALIQYADGDKAYILAPTKLGVGDQVISANTADIKPGNCLPLRYIPVGTDIHAVELKVGRGAQIGRSAGTKVTLMAKEDMWATLRMPSGEMRRVHLDCRASIGQIGNTEHGNIQWGKARSEEHTSELQSPYDLVCRLLLEKKKK